MKQIKNELLTVEISEHGAELQSIKDCEGQEYLWDGDADYWGRKSPILFPRVSDEPAWICARRRLYGDGRK